MNAVKVSRGKGAHNLYTPKGSEITSGSRGKGVGSIVKTAIVSVLIWANPCLETSQGLTRFILRLWREFRAA